MTAQRLRRQGDLNGYDCLKYGDFLAYDCKQEEGFELWLCVSYEVIHRRRGDTPFL
jgi:hypothetical protein